MNKSKMVREMKNKYVEYDIVIAEKKLSEQVKRGTEGVILSVHKARDQYDYTVEFLESTGETIDILLVSEKDLESRDKE